MATKFEKLQTRVDETRAKIEQSKDLSTAEKLAKAKELESVIAKIKSDIDSFKQASNEELTEEIKTKLLAEIAILESSFEELNGQFNKEFQKELSDFQEEVANTIPKPTNESTY